MIMRKREETGSKFLKSPLFVRRMIYVLCVLLVLSGAGLAAVSAASGSGSSPELELYKKHSQDNERFDVSNMAPGDKITGDFTVRVHHSSSLKLFFDVEITHQTKGLGDVLQVCVTDKNSGDTICQGTFNEINKKQFSQKIKKASRGITDVTYQVDAWLDTGVGNQYQQALLKADLRWYVKDGGGQTEPSDHDKPGNHGDNGSGLTPRTGDTVNMVLWIIIALCALAIIILILRYRRDRHDGSDDMDGNDAAVQRKLRRSMIIAVLLMLMLIVTTFALITSIVAVKDNTFETGIVKINLNNGEPLIHEDEYLFEPGMRVKKEFFIENEGSMDAYYRIYMDDMAGDLADVIQLTVTEKESGKVLYQGPADELTRGSAAVSDDILHTGERKELTILFHFPEERGNEAQAGGLSFRMSATATQVRNNPGHSFE